MYLCIMELWEFNKRELLKKELSEGRYELKYIDGSSSGYISKEQFIDFCIQAEKNKLKNGEGNKDTNK